MATYTEHHQLHQWEPGDPFLRTDFNEDLAKIDGALGGLEARTAVLPDLSYDLYNLLLQRDYEGKVTGWKKAMIVEGFLDDRCIAAKDDPLILGRRCLTLHKTGLSALDLGCGSDGPSSAETRVLTIDGGGILTGMTFQWHNKGSSAHDNTYRCTLTHNGTALFTDYVYKASKVSGNGTASCTFSFPTPCTVKQGDTVRVSLTASYTNSALLLERSGAGLGGSFQITPLGAASGTMTSMERDVPASHGALAWVRHSGGSVSLALNWSGQARPMSPDGQRTTVEPGEGLPCTESMFRLDEVLPAGPMAVRLDVACGESAVVHVYDYGLILL
ncbi:hypothetical protein [Pseudoflavonifractor sp. MSJ-37]|uniref:hypothetical protein n=1 Tax=Pseudoflavonifractor sp. MSJ-37 TaxID=2841531 RepID=UPI001C125AFF|nr:hypothetical protein [Pseudoflavonifractor sp. MSJ-37]MBU5436313.1 hypothetical protein [Pseudoflavonifractor sp. MSJ-37]